MAERTGLEPATSGVTGRHSNQLNYRSVTAWWVLQGSNLRPTACRAVALPTELNTRASERPMLTEAASAVKSACEAMGTTLMGGSVTDRPKGGGSRLAESCASEEVSAAAAVDDQHANPLQFGAVLDAREQSGQLGAGGRAEAPAR